MMNAQKILFTFLSLWLSTQIFAKPDMYNITASGWTQLGADIDGEAGGDEYGHAVSVSADGNRVAIGAPGNDGNGNIAGHVRVFEWNGSTWVQLGADIDGEVEGDRSGYAVSLSSDGNRLAIGARNNVGNGSMAGHTRIYEWNGSSWTQLGADIDGEMGETLTGFAVALSSDGSRVAIGSPGGTLGGDFTGHVRIYEWNGSNWTQVGTDIGQKSHYDRTGWAVSLSSNGNRVAIGAIGYADGAGSTRIYEWNGDNWNQLGTDIEGEAIDDQSGHSVSISSDGDRVAIGAIGNDGNGNSAGHTRIFEWNGSNWNQLGTDIDGEAMSDVSGRSVSLSADGSRVAIGAHFNDGNGNAAGHTRIYKWNGSNWIQLEADIDGEANGDLSGWAVALSADGSRVAIGATGNDATGFSAGHVRVYELVEVCMIEGVNILTTSTCDPWTNTYSQTLEIEYNDALNAGNLVVNGQNFAVTGSPQTVELTDLVSDGLAVDLAIFWSESTDCRLQINNAFTAPTDCSVLCDIISVEAGEPYNCDPNSDIYQRDLTVEYQGTNLSGSLIVSIDGGDPILYSIDNQSPQILPLAGLPSNGQWVDVEVYISEESNCSWVGNNLFQNPQNCGDNAGGECDILALEVGDQICQDENNTYIQELILTYTDAPSSGVILLKANNQSDWEPFPITGSPQTLTLEPRAPGEGEVDVFVKFSDDNGCTFSASNLFTAPNTCIQPPSGDGNVLFVVKDANNMHSGDAAVKTQLENTGYTVMVMSEHAAQTSDATGKDLVLISNTVSSGAVNTKFTYVNVPVVCYESLLFDDLGMTNGNNGSDYGQDSNELTIDIDNAGHPVAGGLSGEPQVYNSSGSIIWGNPNNNAIKVASTQGWYQNQWAVFGYETGSSMVNGMAPARRASLFFKASEVSKLNSNGWALFDAVICWATGCQNARFAPQTSQVPPVKAYPNPFRSSLSIEWEHHAQEVQIIMRNLLGQQVFTQKVWLQGRYQLTMGNLPQGIYILQIIGDGFKQEIKVMKE